MGKTCCISFLNSLKMGDVIVLLGIVINALLAYWIVHTIQYKLTNKRFLKDHFIDEIKEIRNDYKVCLNNLYSNNTHPHRVIPWFKLMNIKVDDLMAMINTTYGININNFKPYQRELPELITNNPDFMGQYNKEKVIFTEISRIQLIKFQQTHTKLFNEIIIKINNSN